MFPPKRFLVSSISLALVLCTCIILKGQTPDSSKKPLTNQDVIELSKAGLSPEVITAKIKSSTCNCDTSPSALMNLKGAGVADSVILVMVQFVPAQATEGTKSSMPEESVTAIKKGFVRCGAGSTEMTVWNSSNQTKAEIARVKCGEAVEIMLEQSSWDRIRTVNGAIGYMARLFISDDISSTQSTDTSHGYSAQYPQLLANMVRVVGYRVIPQQRTTYYQSGSNSSYTSCFGQGEFSSFGNYGNLSMNTNCNTTYTTPTQIPITWQYADVYVVVEDSNQLYLVGCRANWRWSNCKPLIVGEIFPAEISGGTMTLTGTKDGKKEVHAKYNIMQVSPK
jgi:hypothetical protein